MLKKAKQLSREEMRTVTGGDIRKFRDEKCYTQSYVAHQLGIGQSAYQKMETGEVKISVERLQRLAEVFNKSMDEMLGKQNDSSQNAVDLIQIPKMTYELMQKMISQQEKRIAELEEKINQITSQKDILKNSC